MQVFGMFRVWGLGFMVQGLGLDVLGFGIRVYAGIQGLGFRLWELGFRRVYTNPKPCNRLAP